MEDVKGGSSSPKNEQFHCGHRGGANSGGDDKTVIQLDLSDEGNGDDKTRDDRFWQLMRACAQQQVAIYPYSYHHQQYCVIGDALVCCKVKSNLKKPSTGGICTYYDVGSVVHLCSVIKHLNYKAYQGKLARPRFRRQLAIAKPLFYQLRPYLLGKTENLPAAIDARVPAPTLRAVPPSVKRRMKTKLIAPTTTAPASVVSEQLVIDGIEGEFFENSCYMEFLMNWLMHTNLECVKDTRIVKLSAEQKGARNATDENCHHVVLKINRLPATHFFGSGFGQDQKRAFWAASRSIVRRLYHAGLITPVLYHTIGTASTLDYRGINGKRARRIKEWKVVKNAVELFKNEITARMPNWMQLSKDALNATELKKVTDEVLSTYRVKGQKYESKLNGVIRRKRKANDELEANMIVANMNQNSLSSKGPEATSREKILSTLNMPSTSAATMHHAEVNSHTLNAVNKNETTMGRKSGVDDDDCVVVSGSAATATKDKTLPYNVCQKWDVVEKAKAKTVFTIGKCLASNIHENLAYYKELEEEPDVLVEEDEILPPVNLHTVVGSAPALLIPPAPPPSNLEPKYQTLCVSLGVRCVENALAVRNVIKRKKTAFINEFKCFDEHIWKHYELNGQDDRTFSWKMIVRQKLLLLVRQVYEDSNLIAVGSTVNGCGAYNSDMDLCLCQPRKIPSFVADRSYSMHVLKKLHRKFLTDWREVINACHYIPAKVPIIKLEMAAPYQELEIDINCNNLAGIYNSHLLHYYARIDDRFPALCLLVKHWAIKAGINDAMTGTLNSYSLILMVLHFLQCATMPPVLPNLQFLYPTLFNATCSVDSLELFRDLPCPLPPREINTDTVGELLIAFFDYYTHFDFKSYAISIYSGCVYNRELLAANTMRFKIFIEEPYDHQNTARCVTKIENLQLIKQAFASARNAFLRPNAGPPNLLCIGVQ